MVSTTSRGRVPRVYVSGLATTRLTTTEEIRSIRTLSVEVVVYGTGEVSSAPCSSVWLTMNRLPVRTSTVTWRRTSLASKVVSWCTRKAETGSVPTADSTASMTRVG
jgi:hypothetical protein